MNENFIYGYLPYAALLACAVGISRFLQSRRGAQPVRGEWQPGTRALLAGAALVALNHLAGMVLPGAMRAFTSNTTRLFAFEAVSLVGGLLFGWGLVQTFLTRLREGLGSWVVATFYGALLVSVLTGLHIAVGLRWGSAWGLHVVVPYLRSLVALHPDTALLVQAPLVLRVHAMAGFVVLAFAPFARMQARAAPVRPVQDAEPQPVLASPRQETVP